MPQHLPLEEKASPLYLQEQCNSRLPEYRAYKNPPPPPVATRILAQEAGVSVHHHFYLTTLYTLTLNVESL